jgi:hypothetical protein
MLRATWRGLETADGLLGFVREGRFNSYAHHERISFPEN